MQFQIEYILYRSPRHFQTDDPPYTEREDAMPHGLHSPPIHSVGFILTEDDDTIVLFGEYDPKNDEIRAPISIPKCAILNRRCLGNTDAT